MFSCFICKKIISKNSVIYMCRDNSFCSIKCRQNMIEKVTKKLI